MRALILDYDFFSAAGGGQTFYRRVVQRHPDIGFAYPSRGRDLRGAAELPANARPFAVARDVGIRPPGALARYWASDGIALAQALELESIAIALQGEAFDLVEVPSFRPVAHLLRPLFAAYGIRCGRVSLGLLGWQSDSLRRADTQDVLPGVLESYRQLERGSVEAADVRYTISNLHADDNEHHGVALGLVDMHDALEEFPPPAPQPPGQGPPDLWYVGRLDRAKGPDLFLAMAARLPPGAYRRLLLTGPDSTWMPPGQRWSDVLLAQGAALGLAAEYRGVVPDAELRAAVYGGRSVLVVPSRTDSFNYVALEALASGCPVLLSCHAGAAEFLQQGHPHLAPPIIEPEDIAASAAALAALLQDYPARAAALRGQLRSAPLPLPRQGFMRPHWVTAPAQPLVPPDQALCESLQAAAPLLAPAAAAWRPAPSAVSVPVAAVVVVRDAAQALAATLASLARQRVAPAQVLVVDDGSADAVALRSAIAGHAGVVLLRQGRRGLEAAWNRGCALATVPHAALFLAGDLADAGYLASAVAARGDHPAPLLALPWGWLAAGSVHLPAAQAMAPSPGLLVERAAVLQAGGLMPGQAGPGLPMGLPMGWAAASSRCDADVLAWRPLDALLPWYPGACPAQVPVPVSNAREREVALA